MGSYRIAQSFSKHLLHIKNQIVILYWIFNDDEKNSKLPMLDAWKAQILDKFLGC